MNRRALWNAWPWILGAMLLIGLPILCYSTPLGRWGAGTLVAIESVIAYVGFRVVEFHDYSISHE